LHWSKNKLWIHIKPSLKYIDICIYRIDPNVKRPRLVLKNFKWLKVAWKTQGLLFEKKSKDASSQVKCQIFMNNQLPDTERKQHSHLNVLRQHLLLQRGHFTWSQRGVMGFVERSIDIKAPVTPNGDATAFVQRSENMSALCEVAAKYA